MENPRLRLKLISTQGTIRNYNVVSNNKLISNLLHTEMK